MKNEEVYSAPSGDVSLHFFTRYAQVAKVREIFQLIGDVARCRHARKIRSRFRR